MEDREIIVRMGYIVKEGAEDLGRGGNGRKRVQKNVGRRTEEKERT